MTTSCSYLVPLIIVLYCTYSLSYMSFPTCAATVPALYVFGDSLADVGNNNYLDFSFIKADFPHNGIDFPGSIATGRFSNGKNSADILAEKLGLPSSPPYLSIASSSNNIEAFLNGVSFASAGAGVLDATHAGKCLTLNNQIDYYSTVYGDLVQQLGTRDAQKHLSKSIFGIIIGSNDILDYNISSFGANNLNTTPEQQFVDLLITSLSGQLKRIYKLGARKFFFAGTGPIGCCPAQRLLNSTGDCHVESNYLSTLYNKGAASLLEQMKSDLGDMSYSFFDAYNATLQIIQNPTSYGFDEVKAACCGLGNLNAKVACVPISTYCPDRTNHMFWDFYHPTQATDKITTSIAFQGSLPYVYPINVRQLSAL